MQTLTIDPPIPYLLPAARRITIVLVGCGGTGSHIAQTLARLSVHCRDTGGPEVTLVLVDGDIVEDKNVGRQLFAPADVGKNKAQVLAARMSAVFGLSIQAIPHMLGNQAVVHYGHYGILVGAVDGAAGRRAISARLGQNWRLWLDCGNHESSGQVAIGAARSTSDMRDAIRNGLCERLPSPGLLYPELLTDAPVVPRADCAAAVLDNAQSLMVNQIMASIAGQYLYDVVVRRKLTRFRTVVDTETLTMRSDAITVANLALACNVTPRHLTKTTKRARRQG